MYRLNKSDLNFAITRDKDKFTIKDFEQRINGEIPSSFNKIVWQFALDYYLAKEI